MMNEVVTGRYAWRLSRLLGDALHASINDPTCEAQKAAQNQIYASNKAVCETAKAAQNAEYATVKAGCEASKAGQDAIYKANMVPCETEKAANNVNYAHLKLMCESAKTGGKYACEVYKAHAQLACLTTNMFNGDLFGPSEVNLVKRAMNSNPMLPDFGDLKPTVVHGGPAGEAQLLAGTQVRIGASYDRDNVGDDLNLIIELLMSEIRFPTLVSKNAVHEYAVQRQNSYGSYMGEYRSHFGDDCTDEKGRITTGIAAGWKPDVSPVFGAIRWYERPCTGANPQLATLYSVIVAHFIR
jgi:hypothetical protein